MHREHREHRKYREHREHRKHRTHRGQHKYREHHMQRGIRSRTWISHDLYQALIAWGEKNFPALKNIH